MTYFFQSKDRNTDLGEKIQFRNYQFVTDNVELAATVRNNCKSQPSLYWETTSEVLASVKQEKPIAQDKPLNELPKRGRPPIKQVQVVSGTRTSEIEELRKEQT